MGFSAKKIAAVSLNWKARRNLKHAKRREGKCLNLVGRERQVLWETREWCNILIERLHKFVGLSGTVLKWFTSYLTGKEFFLPLTNTPLINMSSTVAYHKVPSSVQSFSVFIFCSLAVPSRDMASTLTVMPMNSILLSWDKWWDEPYRCPPQVYFRNECLDGSQLPSAQLE